MHLLIFYVPSIVLLFWCFSHTTFHSRLYTRKIPYYFNWFPEQFELQTNFASLPQDKCPSCFHPKHAVPFYEEAWLCWHIIKYLQLSSTYHKLSFGYHQSVLYIIQVSYRYDPGMIQVPGFALLLSNSGAAGLSPSSTAILATLVLIIFSSTSSPENRDWCKGRKQAENGV